MASQNQNPTDATAQFDTIQAHSGLATFAIQFATELPRVFEDATTDDWSAHMSITRRQFTALFLYQHARGIATAELARQVETCVELRDQFDLRRAPTQETLSRAWRHQFTSRDRRAIIAAATQMRRLYTAHQQRTA